MRRFFGPVAALAAMLLFVLTGGQALAANVNCGDVITQSTTLDSDLNCSGTGILIGADNVTLDLSGHTVAGDGGRLGQIGIANTEGHDHVVVKNGAVTGFS